MDNTTSPAATLPSGSAKFAEPQAHTPGPWTAEAEREGGPVTYVHAKAHGIADCNAGYPNDEANARLIAAAPELYEALRALRSALSSGVEVTQKVIPQVDAALAKARGDA